MSTLYTDPTVLQQFALSRYIYPSAEEEIPPQINLAIKEETYHNVSDFWDLWMNLRNSLTRAVLTREREIIAKLNGGDSEPLEKLPGVPDLEKLN